jgi:hypothetical protein
VEFVAVEVEVVASCLSENRCVAKLPARVDFILNTDGYPNEKMMRLGEWLPNPVTYTSFVSVPMTVWRDPHATMVAWTFASELN